MCFGFNVVRVFGVIFVNIKIISVSKLVVMVMLLLF